MHNKALVYTCNCIEPGTSPIFFSSKQGSSESTVGMHAQSWSLFVEGERSFAHTEQHRFYSHSNSMKSVRPRENVWHKNIE